MICVHSYYCQVHLHGNVLEPRAARLLYRLSELYTSNVACSVTCQIHNLFWKKAILYSESPFGLIIIQTLMHVIKCNAHEWKIFFVSWLEGWGSSDWPSHIVFLMHCVCITDICNWHHTEFTVFHEVQRKHVERTIWFTFCVASSVAPQKIQFPSIWFFVFSGGASDQIDFWFTSCAFQCKIPLTGFKDVTLLLFYFCQGFALNWVVSGY